ncbi:hypothetical protein MRB53_037595 [Persea americana]|nr:hypothetical protein MRB53_037595 [Persea americana]
MGLFSADAAPRGEDDNVPDDFKRQHWTSEWRSCERSTSSSPCSSSPPRFCRLCPFFNRGYKHWIQTNSWMMWISLFGAIGFMLLTFWKRKSYPTNLLFLGGFTMLEAYSVSVITSFYDSRIVLEALIFTLGIFVALTIFACQSKYDFTSWMPYLFGGFMSAFFPHNSKVELGYGVISALIFSGYILVDTQLVMRHYHVEEEIAAAISLYLDIINLFLSILRILNSQNNN